MNKHEICEATLEDLPEVFRCAMAMYEELPVDTMPFTINPPRLRDILEARIRAKNGIVYVLKLGGQVRGIVVGHIVKFDDRYLPQYGNFIGRISEIYVDPELRRQNFAKALVQKAEAWFYSNEIRYIEADIVVGNLSSEQFFGRMGFSNLSWTVYKAHG